METVNNQVKDMSLKERILVLNTIYGKLRRLNYYLYITDGANLNSYGLLSEKIIHITDGRVLEDRAVWKKECQIHPRKNSKDKTIQIKYEYLDYVDLYDDIVITRMQRGNNHCRIYNEYGNLIFIMRDSDCFNTEVVEIENNKVLIYTHDKKASVHIIIYDKTIRKIEDYYYGIINYTNDGKEIRATVYNANKGITYNHYNVVRTIEKRTTYDDYIC